MSSSSRQPERVAQRAQMLLDQVRRESSCPAGTGVCVVNTICADTRRIASSTPMPSVCHAAGGSSRARQTRYALR